MFLTSAVSGKISSGPAGHSWNLRPSQLLLRAPAGKLGSGCPSAGSFFWTLRSPRKRLPIGWHPLYRLKWAQRDNQNATVHMTICHYLWKKQDVMSKKSRMGSAMRPLSKWVAKRPRKLSRAVATAPTKSQELLSCTAKTDYMINDQLL